MLKYPALYINNLEYSCVKCPTALVDFYCTLETLENRRKRHTEELALLQDTNRKYLGLGTIAERVVNDVANMQFVGDADVPEQRESALRELVPSMRKLATYGSNAPGMTSDDIAVQVLAIYSIFDVNSFWNDLAKVLQSPEDTDLHHRLLKAEENTKRADREIVNHLDTIDSLFSSMPTVWRDDQVPPSNAKIAPEVLEDRKRRLALRIVRTFVSEWKTRAPLFSGPVTIAGILISSLPAGQRAAWQAAYDRLKLSDIPKRPCFQSITFKHQGPKASTEEDAPLSIFGKALAAIRGESVSPAVTGGAV
jgi:hypothetical protein